MVVPVRAPGLSANVPSRSVTRPDAFPPTPQHALLTTRQSARNQIHGFNAIHRHIILIVVVHCQHRTRPGGFARWLCPHSSIMTPNVFLEPQMTQINADEEQGIYTLNA